MSEKPLFQNTDTQEAAYAPQELPANSAEKIAADTDDGYKGANAGISGDDIPVPAAGAGLAGQVGGGFSSTTVGGEVGAVGPAVGGAVAADDVNDDVPNNDRM